MIKFIILLNLSTQMLEIIEAKNPNPAFQTAYTEYNKQVIETILEKLKACENVLNETFAELGNPNEFQTLKFFITDALKQSEACIENGFYNSHTNRTLKLKINKITKTISELNSALEWYFDVSQRTGVLENLPYKPFNKFDDVTEVLHSKLEKNSVESHYLDQLKETCNILSRESSNLQELSVNLLEALNKLIVIREKTVYQVDRELEKFIYKVVKLYRKINPNSGFDDCINQINLAVIGHQDFVPSSRLLEIYNNGESGISNIGLLDAKRELILLEEHSKQFVHQLEIFLGIPVKTYDHLTFLAPVAAGSSSNQVSIRNLLNPTDNSFTAQSPCELLPTSNSTNSYLKKDLIDKDKSSFSEENENFIDFE